MNGIKLFIAIIIMCVVTFATRLFPFVLFGKEGKNPPDIIFYLGRYLPPAIISCILVFCLKDVNFFVSPFGIREILSVVTVVVLYLFKSNSMLSILSGTFVYIIFTQFLY